MTPPLARLLFASPCVAIVLIASHTGASAPAGQYTYPSTGTVLDTKTKLTWQQAPSGSVGSFADAQAYCAGLALAGAHWRLPTAKELLTLMDFSKQFGEVAMIDLTAFPSTPAKVFWTATTVHTSDGVTRDGWYNLDFGQGGFGIDFAGFAPGASIVRCVQ